MPKKGHKAAYLSRTRTKKADSEQKLRSFFKKATHLKARRSSTRLASSTLRILLGKFLVPSISPGRVL